MKNSILFLLSLFLVGSVVAQSGLSLDDINKIKQSYKKNDPYTKAITNAVSNNIAKDLALNRENVGKFDHEFKYKVSVKGITNQKSSGRCWMFTSLNILRPKAIKNYNLESFEFSENYLYFWDIFEKSNLFLEGIIETKSLAYSDRKVSWLLKKVVSDGGVWNSFTNLADKYGIVPKSVMPETKNSESTRFIIRFIKRKLREDAIMLRENKGDNKILKSLKINMLGDIYKILAVCLGEPPAEFYWRKKDKSGEIDELKKYTPLSFMKESVGKIDFKDYIMFMDDPTRPYYKLYEIEKDRNVLEGRNWKYINLPAEAIKKYAFESIKNNEAMYFSCDVGKQLNNNEGLLSVDNYDYESILGVKFGMNKKQRILSFDSGSSHGMALVGVDTDKNDKITKWLLENSWGSDSGNNGYLTMTDKWFDEYMFRVVVLKKFVDEKTLKILNQEPTMLPPWDPMFKTDE